jgi:TIR domain
VDVFISYSHSSDETAKVLAAKLQASGMHVFFDRQAIPTGEHWDPLSRRKALDAADAFVVLIDQHTEASTEARRELSEILKRTWEDESKVIVPVVIGDAELPGFLRDVQAVRIEEGGAEAATRTVSRRLTQDPGGVHRSEAGEARLKERLTDIEDRAAQELADDEDA